MANEIYNTSAWGSPMEIGWGSIYYRFAFPSAIPALLVTLQGMRFRKADILLQSLSGNTHLMNSQTNMTVL